MNGLANIYQKVNNYSFIVVRQLTKIAAPNTSFFEKIMENCFIIASYLSLICLIMDSYMRHGWIWWRILDTAIYLESFSAMDNGAPLLCPLQSEFELVGYFSVQRWSLWWRCTNDFFMHKVKVIMYLLILKIRVESGPVEIT